MRNYLIAVLTVVAAACPVLGRQLAVVLSTGQYEARVDSVAFVEPDTFYVTPDFGGTAGTFDTLPVAAAALPAKVKFYYRLDGSPKPEFAVEAPAFDIWYDLPAADQMPEPAKVRFVVLNGVAEDGAVAIARLSAAPSPFSSATALVFSLSRPSSVRLEVFDAAGRIVRTIVTRGYGPGVHRVEWDAVNDEGRRVPAGMYVARLTAGSVRTLAKLVLTD